MCAKGGQTETRPFPHTSHIVLYNAISGNWTLNKYVMNGEKQGISKSNHNFFLAIAPGLKYMEGLLVSTFDNFFVQPHDD